jgi:enterochelin esterase-like enzyme
MNRLWLLTAITVVVSASLISGVEGQSTRHGTTQVITVHGRSLEGNLEGDLSDRQVYVYLPPSYQLNPTRRYPVVYLLHGFSATAALMFSDAPQSIKVPAGSDRAFADGSANEMIVVVPDAYTKYAGSYYSSSILTGGKRSFGAI